MSKRVFDCSSSCSTASLCDTKVVVVGKKTETTMISRLARKCKKHLLITTNVTKWRSNHALQSKEAEQVHNFSQKWKVCNSNF